MINATTTLKETYHLRTKMSGTRVVKVKLLIIGMTSLLIGIQGLRIATFSSGHWMLLRLLAGVVGVPSTLFALVTFWMTTMRISYSLTVRSAYMLLATGLSLRVFRFPTMRDIKNSWKNPRVAQEDYLRKIMNTNADTAYVRDFRLQGVTSLEELRKRHPLTDYERYRPYVERTAKGEQGLLTRDPPFRFALTSGTTGKAKMIPYPASIYVEGMKILHYLNTDILVNSFGFGGMLQTETYFYTDPAVAYTESGLVKASASKMSDRMKKLTMRYPTPPEGFSISDSQAADYVHTLFALRDRNLRGFCTVFTSKILSVMRELEQRWPDFVRDIEEGTVSLTSSMKISPEIHQALVKALDGGDRERAAELRREFQKGFDGILKRVWPYIEFSKGHDAIRIKDALLNSYVKGVPLHGPMYSSTEGIFGINLWPKSQKEEFALLPGMTVLEFIPEDKMLEDQPETLFMDQLQVGGVYEVVVTQIFGLYRFRFGDVVRVTRYHMATPVIEFMYRSGQMLNVDNEKLDQKTVQSSIVAAVGRWPDVTLRDYAVAESTLLDKLVRSGTKIPRPYYVIFIEVDGDVERTVKNRRRCLELLNTVDEELRRTSWTYGSRRKKESIAPPLVHIVQSGTFERLHDFIMQNSTTSENQYKVPRKLRTEAMLKLMLESSLITSDWNQNG